MAFLAVDTTSRGAAAIDHIVVNARESCPDRNLSSLHAHTWMVPYSLLKTRHSGSNTSGSMVGKELPHTQRAEWSSMSTSYSKEWEMEHVAMLHG